MYVHFLFLSVPNTDVVLSCSFDCHHSVYLHCNVSSSNFKCFVDAVSAVCSISNCLGCLVTANETTVTVIPRNDSYFVFDSHARNHLGVPGTNGTAVLLQFSSLEAGHSHMKQLHGIVTGEGECHVKWQKQHNEQCHSDVADINADSQSDTASESTNDSNSATVITFANDYFDYNALPTNLSAPSTECCQCPSNQQQYDGLSRIVKDASDV